jgi:hypothetical protein
MVKELGDASKSNRVGSCGYMCSKKAENLWLILAAFYEILLESKGVTLGAGYSILVLGKAYSAMFGCKPVQLVLVG